MMVPSLTRISDKMLDANRERWSGVASSHAATRSVIRAENCLTIGTAGCPWTGANSASMVARSRTATH